MELVYLLHINLNLIRSDQHTITFHFLTLIINYNPKISFLVLNSFTLYQLLMLFIMISFLILQIVLLSLMMVLIFIRLLH